MFGSSEIPLSGMHSWCQEEQSEHSTKNFQKIFAKLRKNRFPGCIADRKDKSLSEMEVLQMQNAMRVDAMPQEDEIPDEELIDTLIAISVVAKRLAMKLRKVKDEGDKQNEPHE